MKNETFLSADENLAECITENYQYIESELSETGIPKSEIIPLVELVYERLSKMQLNSSNTKSIEKASVDEILIECKKTFIHKELSEIAQTKNSFLTHNNVDFANLTEDQQKKAFGQTVKSLRSEMNLTQEQFYHATGINTKRYENGNCMPNFSNLCKLVVALRIDLPRFCAELNKSIASQKKIKNYSDLVATSSI